MSGITILYATTSGATRDAVDQMAHVLRHPLRVIDLRALDEMTAIASSDLIIAGGPTYGRGDWHYLWESKFDLALPFFYAARRVVLFGLGDMRFHGETFCGGLGRLFDALRGAGIDTVGSTPSSKYSSEATPSLRVEAFPGFVVDYRIDRLRVGQQFAAWLTHFAPDCVAQSAWGRSPGT